jgi:hypothetical protein
MVPTPDEPGFRIDFPAGAGKIFASIVFPLLAAPVLFFLIQVLRSPAGTPSRSVALAVAAVFLAGIAAGFFLTLRMLARRPTAVEVRDQGLTVHFGSRREEIDWASVRGVEQIIVRMIPTYVVLFHGRGDVVVGSGERAVQLAQAIVRRAGLRWIHEPFSARR